MYCFGFINYFLANKTNCYLKIRKVLVFRVRIKNMERFYSLTTHFSRGIFPLQGLPSEACLHAKLQRMHPFCKHRLLCLAEHRLHNTYHKDYNIKRWTNPGTTLHLYFVISKYPLWDIYSVIWTCGFRGSNH